jgi:uncharacterized protein YjbI with pentapeptide repeats
MDRRKERATIRKMILETKILALQLTPWHRRLEALKVIAGASGLFLVFLTVVGGIWSAGSWMYDQRRNREIRVEERLDRALSLLAEQSANKRLSAVISLRSFLAERNETQNSQVLLALSGLLAIEEAGPVRAAVLSTLRDLDVDVVQVPVLNRALYSLVGASKGLVEEADLWQANKGYAWGFRLNIPAGPRLEALAGAIVILMRKGARAEDMSGIYLARSNLSRLDLRSTKFDESILARTDFSGSDLQGASFDSADLEGAIFVEADLRRAKLSTTERWDTVPPRWNYVRLSMDRSGNGHVWMPDFSCADLREADFTGHTVFGVMTNELAERPRFFPPRFWNANVANARFGRATLATWMLDDFRTLPIPVTHGSGMKSEKPGEPWRGTYHMDQNAPLAEDHKRFLTSLRSISHAFSGSNWREADLPRAIAEWLTINQPARQAPVLVGEKPCEPRSRLSPP